ncbi:hypothetical protein HY479_00855 [Candidatus Uhrbacteria bacterium]|nr:hypothetical protein [Candidatus Uhrbacteria bacterium]
MIRSSHRRPVYREVLSQALQTAWHDRRYWLLSVLAGVLVTAGSYDVLWNAVTNISSQGPFIAFSSGMALVESVATAGGEGVHWAVSLIGGVETILFLALMILFVAGLSCIAQGGLVFAIGARKRGKMPTLAEAFQIGAHALWPIIVLNIVVLASVWILRFLISLPLFLALQTTTAGTYLAYLVSFIVFLPLIFVVSILHIFALNAMILQGASLPEAIRRGYRMIAENWVVIFETAVLQVALSLLVWFVFVVALLLAFLPLFLFFFASVVASSQGLLAVGLLLGSVVFIVGLIAAAAFTIQLQYATWTYLYRRLGEGGVVPKIHRIFRGLFGFFGVPQA